MNWTCVNLTHTKKHKHLLHVSQQERHKTQHDDTHTHSGSREHVLICLIKSQLLLPIATLPLSHHSNWQPEETAEGHSLFSLDTQAWQSYRPRPYWPDKKSRWEVSNCAVLTDSGSSRAEVDHFLFLQWKTVFLLCHVSLFACKKFMH